MIDTDTAELLAAIDGYLRRFIVCTDDQHVALALWVAHTYVYDAYDTTPYLIITSAEKGSGKTRVLECIAPLCQRPDTLAAVTEATLFRIVSDERPTLLLDEVDTIFKESKNGVSERQEGLRAILNAGYRKGTRVPRCMPNNEIMRFEVYGPKAFAAIGSLPETIEHRGLRLRMERKDTARQVERFRLRRAWADADPIRKGLEDWAPGARLLLSPDPPMPDELDDRAQDAYEVLCGVADLSGNGWSESGRRALLALRGAETVARESMGMRLLRDIGLFAHKFRHLEQVPTADLLGYLYADGEEPWSDWWRGKDGESYGKKAAMGLSKLLREYEVRPTQIWHEGANVRGYEVTPLLDVVGRYIGEKVARSLDPLVSEGLPSREVARPSDLPSDRNPSDTNGSSDPSDLLDVKGVRSLDWMGQASLDELRDELTPDP